MRPALVAAMLVVALSAAGQDTGPASEGGAPVSPSNSGGPQVGAPAAPVVAGIVARLESDPLELIGWTLDQAIRSAGAPSEVFAWRGAEAWQDDVVFYYGGGVYLFWYRNRVWQVRTDSGYTGSLLGLRMGDAREKVIATVSRPYLDVDGSMVFLLPDASLVELPGGQAKGPYPLRLRVFFQDGRLSDAYLYRGDF